MGEVNYAELYAAAIAESGTGSEIIADGEYDVKIGTVKPGNSKAGKFQVGIRLEITSGAKAGSSTWVNQTFSPENPKAVAVFLRILKSLGVPQEAINAALPPEQLCAYIVVGSAGKAVLAHHVHGDNTYQDLKKFTLGAVASGVPAQNVPTPAVAAPAAPVAAPAPVAPAAPPLPVQAVQEAVPAPVAPAGSQPVPF